MIIYRGPSQLDASREIICVVTDNSSNIKTGSELLQTWILDATTPPIENNRLGTDSAICGECQHRGKALLSKEKTKGFAAFRSCYVNLLFSPNNIYKCFKRGKYKYLDNNETRNLGKNRLVRVGSYGDGAAIPIDIWKNFLAESLGHTGYTHQLINSKLQINQQFAGFADFCMISADSIEQAQIAWGHGWRTFRVINDIQELEYSNNEVHCPASKEYSEITGNPKRTCDKFQLCKGSANTKAKSVAIVAHGSGKKHFQQKTALVAKG